MSEPALTISGPLADAQDSRPPHRVAIVGGGPRGLYCLQTLVDQLWKQRASGSVELRARIDIFEPAEYPGAGVVYDPRQPSWLRMNFAARYIDAWCRKSASGSRLTGVDRLNFCQWLQQQGATEYGSHSFVPRALVGRYLHDCFLQVCRLADAVAELHIHRDRVTGLSPAAGGWRLQTDTTLHVVDDVALTVGHEGLRSKSSVPGSASGFQPFDKDRNTSQEWIPALPAVRNLCERNIPYGSTVNVRGFGLTMIDAVLALTEGRGGTFRCDGSSYFYEPSGREPDSIVAWSRTARPMLAKPDESRFRPTHDLEKVWQSGRKQLARVPRPVGKSVLNCLVRPILMNSARRAMISMSEIDEVPSEAVLDRWFRRWCDHSMTGEEAISLLRNSFEVAVAKRRTGIAWSLGAAWRGLYPALVELVSHGGLMPEAWPAFRRLESEMERLAFGPPAENVGRLLALFDCGLVHVRSLPDADDDSGLPSGVNTIDTTQVRYVDAVLPSPHEHSAAGPLAQLLKAGWIERMEGASGVHIDASGHPVTQDSSTPVGLAVFGRATEGCVLGNDTLSRTLHKHPLRWAETLIQRCCRKVNS